MKTVNLADWSELLEHGQELGHDWNELHEFIANESDFLPSDGDGTICWDLSEIEGTAYKMHPIAKEVIISFYKKNNVDCITWTI